VGIHSQGVFIHCLFPQEEKLQEYEFIDVTQAGEIVTVALNRPKLNLFNERMMRELIRAFSTQRENTSARFIILTARDLFTGVPCPPTKKRDPTDIFAQ